MSSPSGISSSDGRYSDLSSGSSPSKNEHASVDISDDDEKELNVKEENEAAEGDETNEVKTESEEEVEDDETGEDTVDSANSARSHEQDVAQCMVHERQNEQQNKLVLQKVMESNFPLPGELRGVRNDGAFEKSDVSDRNTSVLGKRSFSNSDLSPKDINLHRRNEANAMSTHIGEVTGGSVSRPFTIQRTLGDLPPSAEICEGNKRPTILCEFFAKGWCIRGSSCRFSHDKDDPNHRQMTDVTALATNKEGVLGSSRMPVSADGWPRTLSKDNPSFISSLNRELDPSPNMMQGRSGDYHDPNAAVNGNHPRSGTELFPVRDSYLRSSASSNTFQGHDLAIPGKQDILVSCKEKDDKSDVRDSLWCSRAYSFGSSWSKTLNAGENSLPFSSSMLKASVDYSKSAMSGGASCHTPIPDSFRRSHSPFSVVQEGNLHSSNQSWALRRFSGYKIRLPLSNWEPSVPFKPSFFVGSSSSSSPGDQYDPLRDSIEQRPSYDRPNNYPYYFDASIRNTSDYGATGKSVSKLHNANAVPDERKHVTGGHPNNSGKHMDVDFNMDSRHKSAGEMHKDGMVSRELQRNGVGMGLFDEDTQKMSRAARHFRTMLIEYVKELIKPSWHKGNFSKDSYKVIVKKAVDKVINTIEGEQIPCTGDAIKQYLSSSHRKIAKLVEGYVDKYGKF